MAYLLAREQDIPSRNLAHGYLDSIRYVLGVEGRGGVSLLPSPGWGNVLFLRPKLQCLGDPIGGDGVGWAGKVRMGKGEGRRGRPGAVT